MEGPARVPAPAKHARLVARAILVALALTAALAAGLPASTARAAGAAGGLHQVGSVRIPYENCGIYSRVAAIDAPVSALVTVSANTFSCPGGPSTGVWLRVTSTTTLRQLVWRPVVLPVFPVGLGQPVSASDLMALRVDATHGRLFLLYQGFAPATAACPIGVRAAHVAVFDLKSLTASTKTLLPTSVIDVPLSIDPTRDGTYAISPDDPTEFAGSGVLGATCIRLSATDLIYDPRSDSIDVTINDGYQGYYGPPSIHGLAAPMYLFDFSASTGAERWAVQLGRCVAPLGDPSLQASLLRTNTSDRAVIAGGCLYSRAPSTGPSAGLVGLPTSGSMAVWLVAVDTHGAPATSPAYEVGRPGALSAVADAKSGRIFFPGLPLPGQTDASAPGPTAVIFDVASRTFIGAPTVGLAQAASGFAFGVSPYRWYSAGPGGLFLGDTRSTPPGQGVWYSGYSCRSYGMLVDPSTQRLFVVPATSCANSSAAASPFFVVYQDSVPLPALSPDPNPDTYTMQVDEEAGVTTAQYNGHGDATALRVRNVGGVTGDISGGTFGGYDALNGSQVFGPYLTALYTAYTQTTGQQPPSGDYAGRELDLASVNHVDLGNFQAAAGSQTASIDDVTGSTYTTYRGQNWPFKESDCSDPGSASGQDAYGPDMASSVSCRVGGGQAPDAEALSTAGPVGITTGMSGCPLILVTSTSSCNGAALPTSLGSFASSAHVYLDAKLGLVSDTFSSVTGVDLGAVQIGKITAEARCWAHGRTGSASCIYTRTLTGVVASGTAVPSSCTEEYSASVGAATDTDTCHSLVASLNSLQPGIVVFSLPGPDRQTDYLPGSPGGYQGVVQREFFEHLQDSVLDFDNSLQLPALEILYVNDSPTSTSRLDFQFANVEADSHYGISLLNQGGGGPLSNVGQALAGALSPIATLTSAPMAGAVQGAGQVPYIGPGLSQVLERVFTGVRWILRSPLTALTTAIVLWMLVAPVLLSNRRGRLELVVAGKA